MKSERQLIDVAEARGYVETFMADPILKMAANAVLNNTPRVDAIEIPKTGIGDLSDGYHTFNGLYYQRLILFSALVKAHKDRAWKSYRHEDGELCFGGGWFIAGIDTPEGSYTYHYENQYFDLFECVELPVGKPWDGHAEEDVVRLLSLQPEAVEVVWCKDCKYAMDMMPIENSGGCLMGECTLRKEDDIVFTAWGDDFCSYGERKVEDG